MKILENLKLDSWYGILLYIGISFRIAEKYAHSLKHANIHTGPAGYFSWKIIKHNLVSIIILLIGIGVTGLFGFLIVKNLI